MQRFLNWLTLQAAEDLYQGGIHLYQYAPAWYQYGLWFAEWLAS